MGHEVRAGQDRCRHRGAGAQRAERTAANGQRQGHGPPGGRGHVAGRRHELGHEARRRRQEQRGHESGQPPVYRRAQHARHEHAQRAEERDDVEHGVSAGGALEERHEERHAGGIRRHDEPAFERGTVAGRRERPVRKRPRQRPDELLIDAQRPVRNQIGLADIAVRVGGARDERALPDAERARAEREHEHERNEEVAGQLGLMAQADVSSESSLNCPVLSPSFSAGTPILLSSVSCRFVSGVSSG